MSACVPRLSGTGLPRRLPPAALSGAAQERTHYGAVGAGIAPALRKSARPEKRLFAAESYRASAMSLWRRKCADCAPRRPQRTAAAAIRGMRGGGVARGLISPRAPPGRT